jgi:hypothetical protein
LPNNDFITPLKPYLFPNITMPTHYYVETTDEAKELVDQKNYKGIDDFCKDDLHTFYLASHAVDTENIDVINHLSKKINFHYISDGNAYNLIHLAAENMREKNLTTFVLDKLCKIAEENKEDITNLLSLASKEALRYDVIDYDIVNYFVNKLPNITTLFHFSLCWDQLDVGKYLFEKHSDKIDLDHTSVTYEICERFKANESMKYIENHPILSKWMMEPIKCSNGMTYLKRS